MSSTRGQHPFHTHYFPARYASNVVQERGRRQGCCAPTTEPALMPASHAARCVCPAHPSRTFPYLSFLRCSLLPQACTTPLHELATPIRIRLAGHPTLHHSKVLAISAAKCARLAFRATCNLATLSVHASDHCTHGQGEHFLRLFLPPAYA